MKLAEAATATTLQQLGTFHREGIEVAGIRYAVIYDMGDLIAKSEDGNYVLVATRADERPGGGSQLSMLCQCHTTGNIYARSLLSSLALAEPCHALRTTHTCCCFALLAVILVALHRVVKSEQKPEATALSVIRRARDFLQMDQGEAATSR